MLHLPGLVFVKSIQLVHSFSVFKDETTMAQFFPDMKERGPAGRKRKRGPKQGGGPAKREDLKRETTRMEEAKKESTKRNTKRNSTGNVAGKAGGQRQGESRLSSNNASKFNSKRFVITVYSLKFVSLFSFCSQLQ